MIFLKRTRQDFLMMVQAIRRIEVSEYGKSYGHCQPARSQLVRKDFQTCLSKFI
jgi:hypothetical protein